MCMRCASITLCYMPCGMVYDLHRYTNINKAEQEKRPQFINFQMSDMSRSTLST